MAADWRVWVLSSLDSILTSSFFNSTSIGLRFIKDDVKHDACQRRTSVRRSVLYGVFACAGTTVEGERKDPERIFFGKAASLLKCQGVK